MNFELSKAKLNTRGKSSGLSPQLLPSSSIATGGRSGVQVNSNAGNRRNTPTNIPGRRQDNAAQGAQNFMQAAANAAFSYEERESTYLAGQASAKYAERLRELYSGYEGPDGTFTPGYEQSKGESAITGYGAFKEQINQEMQTLIEGLEPRVRQKALLQIQSYNNTYLGKAATHRAKELRSSRDDQLEKKRQSIMFDMISDPSKIATADPVTGLSKKGEYKNTFDSQEKADTEWVKAVGSMTELVYHSSYRDAIESDMKEGDALNHAFNQANLYVDGVAAPELLSDSDGSSLPDIYAKLKRWKNEGVSALAQQIRADNSTSDAIREEAFRQGEKEISDANTRGEKLSRDYINTMVQTDRLKPSIARQYLNDNYEVEMKTTNPMVYAETQEALIEAVTLDPNTNIRDVIDMFSIRSIKERDELIKFGELVKNPELSPRFNHIYGLSKSLISITNVLRKENKEAEASQRVAISGIIAKSVAIGLPTQTIIEQIKSRLPAVAVPIDKQIAFPRGEKPKNKNELYEVHKKYFDEWQNAVSTLDENDPKRMEAVAIMEDVALRKLDYDTSFSAAEKSEKLYKQMLEGDIK